MFRCTRPIALVVLMAAILSAGPARAQEVPPDAVADAYHHFLMARFYEARGLPDEAVLELERAAEIDAAGAEIRAELAALHARQGRVREALAAARTALGIEADNRQAHRVLGTIYGALAEAPADTSGQAAGRETYLTQALLHLEQALGSDAHDPALQLTLGRLYTRAGEPEKAIPPLVRLLEIEGWSADVVVQLAQAYSAAALTDEAVALIEDALRREPDFYRARVLIAELYERQQRWPEAAEAYGHAAAQNPRSGDLGLRRAIALLNGGDPQTAREVLQAVTQAHPAEPEGFFLLAQVEREARDLEAAEAAARHLMTLDGRGLRGPYTLAEVFQQRRQYREIVELIEPLADDLRDDRQSRLTGRLLVLLAGAYQALGDHTRAVATYARAAVALPDRASGEAQLIQSLVSAGRVEEAIAAAQEARSRYDDDLRFVRIEAEALRRADRSGEAVDLLEGAVGRHADDPISWIALSDLYVSLGRFDDAWRILGSADGRFPDSVMIAFKVGAFYDRQERFEDAEEAFRRVLARDPDHAPTLNHLGYMLVEQGGRLEESVELIERALAIDPHNGAYLDSLGWAYFKLDRLDLAERYLRLAAGQLRSSSVVQDHLGDLLFRQGAYREAVEAWERALAGDGVSIDFDVIEEKIRRAQHETGAR